MFGLVLMFVHWGYVYLLHYIIIEHIPECLVWWHSVSYVSYYLTLGHTPILEFIRSFADSLTTRSTSGSSWVIILGHTPHPWVHQIFCGFSHYLIYFLIFASRHTGAYPPILEFIWSLAYFPTAWSISWSLRVVTPGHTPFSAFLLGHTPSLWVYRVSCWFHDCRTHLSIFTSYHLGHPPTVILSRASPFCHLV